MKELKSIDDIFMKKIFRIPDYQRGYAWETKQIAEFWKDVIRLAPGRSHYTGVLSIKEVPETTYNDWEEEKWIIKQKGYKAYYVVDGQQRLTTIIIFLQCLIEVYESLFTNEDSLPENIVVSGYTLKEIIDNFVMISQPPDHIIKTYKFGYEKKNSSSRFLRHKIFNEKCGGNIDESFYTLNLENAKLFFINNIRNIVQKQGTSVLETLFVKITQRLMFNLYEIDDNYDVYVAFETMNNRGKKLSDLELLKNRLIYLTTLYDDNVVPEELKTVVRNSINTTWRTIYIQLGKNKNHSLNDNDFLKAHWIMYFKYSRKRGNDYILYLLNEHFDPQRVFETVDINSSESQTVTKALDEDMMNDDDYNYDVDSKYIEETTNVKRTILKITEIHDYLNSLKEASIHWYNSYFPQNNPDLSPNEQVAMDKINRLGISYFRPLIVSMFMITKVGDNDRLELLNAIERFIFLGFRISRAQSNYKSSQFYNITRELFIYNGREDSEKEGKSIKEIIKVLNDSLSWIYNTDGTFNHVSFKEYITNQYKSKGEGFYSWNGLRYLLYEYEDKFHMNRGLLKISWDNFVKPENDKISIEHIFPQTPNHDYWKSRFGSYSNDEKMYLTGSLGNLLILALKINIKLQNYPFPDKKKVQTNDKEQIIRDGYSNGSHSEIEVANNDDWTAEEIKKRGLKLLAFMEDRWNIKFSSIEAKLDLLHLGFLNDSEIEKHDSQSFI